MIAVIAHRGEHLHHPENTLPAYEAAIRAGADYVEVDVRTTVDGKLVVMHDATVDSRTNGSGRVKDMTLGQILKLDAGIRSGEAFRGVPPPSFEEVLVWVRGRCGVYVDLKDVAPKALTAALERHGMVDRSVIYGGEELLRQLPGLRVMPEAMNAPTARRLVQELRPRVIAFDARDFTDDAIAVAREAGAAIYVDRFGPADNEGAWQNAIDRGATGIQTDKPAELAEYLKGKGYR